MQSDLKQRWTVSGLARRAGLSRAAFARRFVEQTGVSPLRYLTQRRMEHAAQLLRESRSGLAEIAEQVGYASEFAFNRAFKRRFHVAPGGYRRSVWARSKTPSFTLRTQTRLAA
jgi:AraC-like DNA-binding protein